MPMIGVPARVSKYLGCLGLSLNVIVVQGKTINSGTYSIWSTTIISPTIVKSKDYWKKYEAKLFLTISKQRILEMNSKKN